MTNPFDDEDGTFLVVINDEDQHSLWPRTFGAVPDGWTTVHGPAGRQSCLDYVEKNWIDMRPASLVRSMESGSGFPPPGGRRSSHPAATTSEERPP